MDNKTWQIWHKGQYVTKQWEMPIMPSWHEQTTCDLYVVDRTPKATFWEAVLIQR